VVERGEGIRGDLVADWAPIEEEDRRLAVVGHERWVLAFPALANLTARIVQARHEWGARTMRMTFRTPTMVRTEPALES
jgi:hypothetical protein